MPEAPSDKTKQRGSETTKTTTKKLPIEGEVIHRKSQRKYLKQPGESRGQRDEDSQKEKDNTDRGTTTKHI